MVKEKKLTKSSIAVIVLALLLVLSLCLGITGAWFTSNAGHDGNTVTLQFGTVLVNEFDAGTNVTKYGTEAEANQEDAHYLLVAGTEIETRIGFENASTVDIFYALAQKDSQNNWHLYVISADGTKLVEVVASNKSGDQLNAAEVFVHTPATTDPVAAEVKGLGFLAVEDETPVISRKYRVVEAANGANAYNSQAATAMSAAFQVYDAENDEWGAVVDLTGVQGYTCAHNVITYGDNVDLGLTLINGTYQLVAVQADNVDAATAFAQLDGAIKKA